MDKTFEQKITEKMVGLPGVTKRALETFDWKGSLTNIAHKHKLYIDQTESLYEIAMGIMLGEIEPDDLVYKIKDDLIIEKPEAESLVADLEALVFTPIHKFILANSNEDEEEIPEGEGEILSSIENPPASKPVSFAETKIREPHGLKEATQGDSDIPTPPEARGVDPYREEI